MYDVEASEAVTYHFMTEPLQRAMNGLNQQISM